MAHYSYRNISKRYGIIFNHSKRLSSSSKILTSRNNTVLHQNIRDIQSIQQQRNFNTDSGKGEFPSGRYSIPSPTGQGKRPSIRVGGGGISLGPEFEPELDGLPWEPADIHPERPPPGYMNVDGMFDDDIQVDGTKYQHSLLIMPQFVVKWNVNKLEDITPEHFALATIHYPAISKLLYF